MDCTLVVCFVFETKLIARCYGITLEEIKSVCLFLMSSTHAIIVATSRTIAGLEMRHMARVASEFILLCCLSNHQRAIRASDSMSKLSWQISRGAKA